MLLTIRNLTKMYGPHTILDAVSLVINAGECVGLPGQTIDAVLPAINLG